MENDQELETLRQKVLEIEKEARIKIERKVQDGRNILLEPETAIREGSRDFSRFRRETGLTRLADYSHRTGAIWIIVVGLVIESVLNATLLMEVSAFGLLGSIVQMGLISAVNILIAALAMGALLRQCNSVSINKKRLAWVSILLIILSDSIFNIFVGHFRDSMQEILNDASIDIFTLGRDTMQRMLETPLGLESFQSILLALLGFLFFAVASWKWYQRDDPYPDYGRRDRQLKYLEVEHIKMYKKVQGDIEKVFIDYKSKLEDKRHILEIKQSRWREISGRGRKLVDNYPINQQQYQPDLDHLLSVYRTANRETRTEAPPSHFSEQVLLDREIFMPPSFTPPTGTIITGVTNQVHDAITQVQNTFQDASRRFRTLEDIKEDELDGTNT